jgi:electron transfer flavoprotein beta subunit
MNPYDLYALEMGLRLKEKYGGTLKVLSMGPFSALEVIREAIYMGADGGILISDRKFGGADVLATSYTLCSGILAMGEFDLILTGKQTTDGDTAQVGAEMAEWLGLPHVANVKSIDGVCGETISVTVDQPDCEVAERIPFPCLVTVEKGIFEPRLPSYRLMKATEGREIAWLGLKDLDDRDPKHYGLNGSPTQVKRIFPPEAHVEHVSLDGDDVEKAARLADLLEERKFLR